MTVNSGMRSAPAIDAVLPVVPEHALAIKGWEENARVHELPRGPHTTLSICRLPQREQISRLRHNVGLADRGLRQITKQVRIAGPKS
jgi:hypothetical protein